MNYIKITKDNLDEEHICCAMSNKQSSSKKAWLKERFDDGLVFYRSEERGKCFIEYIPAENAWAPIEANEYLFINCFWIAGSLKGHGYSNDLLNQCIDDAKKQGKKGVCILSSVKRKKEFLSDPKYLQYKGFMIADTTECDICLMYFPLEEDAIVPRFKECAKRLTVEDKGYVIYYSDQCPFAYYWSDRVASVAKQQNIEIKVIHIDNKQMAQNMSAPITNYALFRDGKFVTHGVLSDKKFLEITKK